MEKNKNVKVFILDSDRSYLEELRMYLNQRPNLDVSIFSDVETCIAALKENPHLVIVDHQFIEERDDFIDQLRVLKDMKRTAVKSRVVIVYPEYALNLNNNYGDYHIAKDGEEISKLDVVLKHIHRDIGKLRVNRANTRMATMLFGIFFFMLVAGSLSAYFFLK